MTETSDSGFTEINQSRSSDGSQCDKSPTLNSMEESNSQAANSENSENIILAAGSGNDQESQESKDTSNSDSMSSSSEDSDDDYEDSEQGGDQKSVYSWVS